MAPTSMAPAAEDPIEKTFRTHLAVICIGTEHQRYYIHEGLLHLRCPMVAYQCQKNESTQGLHGVALKSLPSIYIPEVFDVVVHFIYTNTLPAIDLHQLWNVKKLFKAYALAWRVHVDIPDMRDAIVSAFHRHWETKYIEVVELEVLQDVITADPKNVKLMISHLIVFVMDTFIRDLNELGGKGRTLHYGYGGGEDLQPTHGFLPGFIDRAGPLAQKLDNDYEHPDYVAYSSELCGYHVHDKSGSCRWGNVELRRP